MNKIEPGVYIKVEDMMQPYVPEPAYYAFFVNVGSWGERLKAFIAKRIEVEPIWIVFDDNSTISHLLITNLSEFYETSKQIDEHLAKIKAKQQMIKDAVHAVIDYPFIGHDFPNIYPDYRELKDYCDKNGIKDNNKVKLFIIKDELV